jgi:hypothetical protein
MHVQIRSRYCSCLMTRCCERNKTLKRWIGVPLLGERMDPRWSNQRDFVIKQRVANSWNFPLLDSPAVAFLMPHVAVSLALESLEFRNRCTCCMRLMSMISRSRLGLVSLDKQRLLIDRTVKGEFSESYHEGSMVKACRF